MFGVYFAASCPQTFDQVMAADKERFNRFFHGMLGQGVYLAPSAFEAGFVSAAHTATDIAATVDAARVVMHAATVKHGRPVLKMPRGSAIYWLRG